MQYLPGWTVQCINPECDARGHWRRAEDPALQGHGDNCPCCGESLRNVPPPLPRLRLRPRPLSAYRPMGRPR
jgi:hypothetical protein